MHKQLFLLLFLSTLTASAQNTAKAYPTDYFRYPLDLSPIIAGNFGELRANHFHSGLDFKTNQREGYPVYAPADGYISRIRVQIGGGGNALYITHPNGYTSVYMHLQRFNERISQTLKTYQYRRQQFDVDFPLLPIEIQVRKGEVIAWSGNTGGSSGPHLHFELRDTNTEETINPQLFGVTIPDRVKPVVSGIYLYHLNGEPFSEHTPKQLLPVTGANGVYTASAGQVIQLGGKTGLGIMTIDRNSASENTNGPYSISLELDGTVIHSAVWENFSFANSRAINSHLDHPALISTGRRIQKSFTEPGNPLGIYKTKVNNGIIDLADDQIHEARFIVADVAGNESVVKLRLRLNKTLEKPRRALRGRKLSYDLINQFDTTGLRLTIPAGVLYSDLDFVYTTSAQPATGLSRVHHIHNRLIPVHNPFTLQIQPLSGIAPYLEQKLLISSTTGQVYPGSFENGYVKADVRAFGNYYVRIDTIAPRIVPVNIAEGKTMAGLSRIQLRISDNLSGIKSFNGMIDGNWVLMEYDFKTGLLSHKFDGQLSAGKHTFQIQVTDQKLNSSNYSVSFYK